MKAKIILKEVVDPKEGMLLVSVGKDIAYIATSRDPSLIAVSANPHYQMWAEVSNGCYPVGTERGPLVECEPTYYSIPTQEEVQAILDDKLVDKEVEGWVNVKYHSFSMILDGVKYDGKNKIKTS